MNRNSLDCAVLGLLDFKNSAFAEGVAQLLYLLGACNLAGAHHAEPALHQETERPRHRWRGWWRRRWRSHKEKILARTTGIRRRHLHDVLDVLNMTFRRPQLNIEFRRWILPGYCREDLVTNGKM